MSKEKQIDEKHELSESIYMSGHGLDRKDSDDIAEQLYHEGYRKQSGWISVEERWPETDGYYLVRNNEQRKIEIRFFHRLSPYYPVETYPEIRAYFGNFSDHKSITHWMPLPEPPEMKGV